MKRKGSNTAKALGRGEKKNVAKKIAIKRRGEDAKKVSETMN